MSNESLAVRESDGSGAAAGSAGAPARSATQPWVSCLSIVTCVAIFVGLVAQNDYESWDALSKFGYLPADSIWKGGYWALISSAFVHVAIWHLAFNMYWLWVLGSRLERAIGSLRFFGFLLFSAFVSSSFQLAVSGDTGIGASGVVYAIFGFMWTARHRYGQFNKVLDARTIQFFNVWLVGCMAATYFKVWEVGNAAHLSGLLLGSAVAGFFVLRYRPRLMRAVLIALVVASPVPLFWCPWSVAWLSHKAYEAHLAEQYDTALARYTRIIQIDPENAWAYFNRSGVYEALGDSEKAQADLQRARDIDPSVEEME